MSVPAHRFKGEDQKKGLRCEIQDFVMTFTRIFDLERKFAYAWGGVPAVFLGGTGPEMHSRGTRPVTLF